MEFARDRGLDTIQLKDTLMAEGLEFLHDMQELRIDNHTATEEYLKQLVEHVKFYRGQMPLERLELDKILFTEPKANLLAELLDDRNCYIRELVFDKCRARPDKMKIIFSALARN